MVAAKIRGLVEARRAPTAAEPPLKGDPTTPPAPDPGEGSSLPKGFSVHVDNPPPLGRLIGQQTDLDQLTSWILDDSRQPIAVLGPGGIGKSRLTITALHDRRVTTRFGDRHHFVSLEEARDGPGVFAAVAAALGLAADSRPQAAVLAGLRASPTLLVLDNAETPWEADRPGAEQAFAVLAQLPTVRLVASLRSHCPKTPQPPSSPASPATATAATPTSPSCSPASTACRWRSSWWPTAPRPSPTPPPCCASGTPSAARSSAVARAAARISTSPCRFLCPSPARA